jgi:hypothetical protein
MRKRTEREIQRQRHWQEIVRGQRESGQSVRMYCRMAAIEESAFYWWRRELARRDRPRNDPPQSRRGACRGKLTRPAARRPSDGATEGSAARRPSDAVTEGPAARRPSDAVTEVAFIPVRVAANRGAEAGRPIEMILGGDRVLRIPPGFDRQTLLDVLGALEVRGC